MDKNRKQSLEAEAKYLTNLITSYKNKQVKPLSNHFTKQPSTHYFNNNQRSKYNDTMIKIKKLSNVQSFHHDSSSANVSKILNRYSWKANKNQVTKPISQANIRTTDDSKQKSLVTKKDNVTGTRISWTDIKKSDLKVKKQVEKQHVTLNQTQLQNEGINNVADTTNLISSNRTPTLSSKEERFKWFNNTVKKHPDPSLRDNSKFLQTSNLNVPFSSLSTTTEKYNNYVKPDALPCRSQLKWSRNDNSMNPTSSVITRKSGIMKYYSAKKATDYKRYIYLTNRYRKRKPQSLKLLKLKKSCINPNYFSFRKSLRRTNLSKPRRKVKVTSKAVYTRRKEQPSYNYYNLDGVLYKSTGTKLVSRLSSVANKDAIVNKRHKLIKLRKVNKTVAREPAVTPKKIVKFGGLLSRKYLEKYSSKKYKINHKMSINQSLASKSVNSIKDANRQYCLFYCRYGKCNRGNECPYVHDPSKVAVCTRFLRGMCHAEDCPFSHQISTDKMPVCSFFLRGNCTKDNCPFSHVRVAKNADLCKSFLLGYCPDGVKCKMRHVIICPEYSRNGQCSKGRNCRLLHRRIRFLRKKGIEISDEKTNNTRNEKQFLAKEPAPFKVIRKQMERIDTNNKKKQAEESILQNSLYADKKDESADFPMLKAPRFLHLNSNNEVTDSEPT
ncbi:Zinc finger CCCH domain-containing protein 3 [Trichoplax sp. H2]|nr:Zinc finger CCCH domain-containing protein 3 [Trichoplax sp. H2]|eukprot:RDD47104.1 Zinc finger CCCH domain-containing protein 3 [Trichoplax sp. H2]